MSIEIPKLIKISGWIWMLTGILTSALIVIQSALTLQSAEFNHSGIIRASLFMIFFVLVFANVGRQVLKGSLKNITANAAISIIFSLLILYFASQSIENISEINWFNMLIIVVPVCWVLASVLALVDRKKYDKWISEQNSIEH